MSTENDVLFRILQTEAARGHDNKTVIGGISKIAPHWITSANSSGLDADTISKVADKLEQYSSLSLADRKIMAHELVEILTYHYTSNAPTNNAQVQEINNTKSDRYNIPTKSHSTDSEFCLETPLTALAGIGPSNANKLKKLGLNNIGDALYHFPHRYIDYSSLKSIKHVRYGDDVTILAKVTQIRQRKTRGGKLSVIEVDITD